MTGWRYWLIVALLVGINSTSASILVAVTSSESTAVFKQLRWITWKMDQRDSEKIQVDAK